MNTHASTQARTNLASNKNLKLAKILAANAALFFTLLGSAGVANAANSLEPFWSTLFQLPAVQAPPRFFKCELYYSTCGLKSTITAKTTAIIFTAACYKVVKGRIGDVSNTGGNFNYTYDNINAASSDFMGEYTQTFTNFQVNDRGIAIQGNAMCKNKKDVVKLTFVEYTY